jgi:DNA-binding transcriptional MerR regulator
VTPTLPPVAPTPAPVLLRISEAAALAGTSTRTLRYYEELGLLRPSRHSVGGARRYSEEDVARLRRIRELQELLGFDLGEIGDILRNEDQLADLRSEIQAGVTPERHRQILRQAMEINDRLRSLVRTKQGRLEIMMQELEAKARRYRARAKELSAGSGASSGRSSS